jgi:predicted Zn-dependent protease
MPQVEGHCLDGSGVRRCRCCGVRALVGSEPTRWVYSCGRCGVPFADAESLPRSEQACEACRTDCGPPDGLGGELRQAIEAEVRAAVGDRWHFAAHAELSAYLDRLLRRIASRLEGAPTDPNVAIVDDWQWRTLALPSGTVLISLGTLDFLEDEAQLAFVLAHELAHAVTGHALTRMVRSGLDGMQRDHERRTDSAWACAAEDIVRLGYGRGREREADERAARATIELGYDPASIVTMFQRLHQGIAAGNPQLAEFAVSHPEPLERARRVEQASRRSFEEDGVARTNREVFRRAAGPRILREQVRRGSLDAASPTLRRPAAGWIAAAVSALGAAAAAAWWLLGG